MTDPIEAVARAICRRAWQSHPRTEAEVDRDWQNYLPDADDAIAAYHAAQPSEVTLPPPTRDQEQYLKATLKAQENIDMSTVVGGPQSAQPSDYVELVKNLRGDHMDHKWDTQAADAIEALEAERDAIHGTSDDIYHKLQDSEQRCAELEMVCNGIIEWYDRDGSVGGISDFIGVVRTVLKEKGDE